MVSLRRTRTNSATTRRGTSSSAPESGGPNSRYTMATASDDALGLPTNRPLQPPIQNFIYEYKSKKPCSERTRLAGQLFRHPIRFGKQASKRAKKKANKIRSMAVEPCYDRAINRFYLDDKLHVFDGRTEKIGNPPGITKESNLVVRSVHDLKIIDSIEGASLYPWGYNNPMVFTLLPRDEAIDDRQYAKLLHKLRSDGNERAVEKMHRQQVIKNKTITDCFEQAESNSKPCKRGANREVLFPFVESKYCTLGKVALRGGPGVQDKDLKISDKAFGTIMSLVKDRQRKMMAYLPPGLILGFEMAKEAIGFRTINDDDKNGVFGSMAFGRNVYLTAHDDEDAFYSVVSTHTSDAYKLNDDILCYFCFPEYGVAVALRPGDVLIFNAQTYHCISSASDPAKIYYSYSLYLKTAIVGLNDNSIPAP